MEYILDVKKWVCGGGIGNNELGHAPVAIGQGGAQMLNDKGEMCCLGQFAKQKDIDDKYLLGEGDPQDVALTLDYNKLSPNYDPLFVDEAGGIYNTPFGRILMRINDDSETTLKQKINAIRSELIKKGHTLKVLNDDIIPKKLTLKAHKGLFLDPELYE